MQTITPAFAPSLAVVDGKATTLSIDVARHFGKRHDDVLKSIRALVSEMDEEHARNFAGMLVDVEIGNGATRQSPAYRLTRDGFTLLAMGFTGKKALQFKLAYIDAFNRMEAALQARPATLSAAQCQHLKELVDLIAESGKQPHAETWARLHRRFKVPRYADLPAALFDEACAYLQGKLDSESIAHLIQRHLPGAIAALPDGSDQAVGIGHDTLEQLATRIGTVFALRKEVDRLHHLTHAGLNDLTHCVAQVLESGGFRKTAAQVRSTNERQMRLFNDKAKASGYIPAAI